MSQIRLYARTRDEASHAVVSRGFSSVLECSELLAGVYPLDDAESAAGEEEPPGASAPIGLLTGGLQYLGLMQHNTRHDERWAMVAPNSNLLPGALLEALHRHTTRLLVPSQWAKGVVEALISDRPIEVVPHGLDAAYGPVLSRQEEAYRSFLRGERRVIHFSTSAMQRKGTVELLQAWEILYKDGMLGPGAVLICVLDYEAKRGLMERLADQELSLPPQVKLWDRFGLPPAKMAFILSEAHVVCQPSRGEAFGLIPLQARACGTPVVATLCTGHSEHMVENGVVAPGCWPVTTGGDGPIDDLPGAVAPTIDPRALAAALCTALTIYPNLQEASLQHCMTVCQTWAWKAQLASFVDRVKARTA